ncbi:hypothetical protein OF83DRAFT_677628 [Amylostereum chailletii]|nr:hypothetical protein OF83DRAFT_677628 [Amylostereum chailletii]
MPQATRHREKQCGSSLSAPNGLQAAKNMQLDLDKLRFMVDSVRFRVVPFIKRLYVSIKSEKGEEIGQMEVLVIYREKALQECESFYEALHDIEYEEFADHLFVSDELALDGYFQTAITSSTTHWPRHTFAKESPLVYIDMIHVEEAWRRKGVGTWAYGRVLVHPLCKDANYLVARPTDGEIETVEEDWSVRFHRKFGFRRLGHTAFFAWAKDPSHPSRAVLPTMDTPYNAPAPMWTLDGF